MRCPGLRSMSLSAEECAAIRPLAGGKCVALVCLAANDIDLPLNWILVFAALYLCIHDNCFPFRKLPSRLFVFHSLATPTYTSGVSSTSSTNTSLARSIASFRVSASKQLRNHMDNGNKILVTFPITAYYNGSSGPDTAPPRASP